MAKIILEDLEATEYEHPLDRAALQKLEAIPGTRRLVKKIWKEYFDKVVYFETTGSNVEVNKDNYPYLYNLLLEACSILNIKEIPPLYLENSPVIGAYATGVNRPIVVLTYAAIERLDQQELLYVIAHELGHIKSGHVLYYYLAQNLGDFLLIAGQLSLGIGALAGNGIKYALFYWRRMSEFTADRAGLLVCQDTKVCIRSFIKLSGLPLDNVNIEDFENSFTKQAKDFEDFDYGALNKLIRLQLTVDNSHPWSVLRASEVLKWAESDEYKRILRRETKQINDLNPNSFKFCAQCGNKLEESQKFCGNCGTQVEIK